MLSALIWACTAPQLSQGSITVNLIADNKAYQVKIPKESTVQEALKTAQITLGELDRVEPALYTVLVDTAQIKVIRVREEYYIEQMVIPFEHQELHNDALPEGERRLSQPGVNGLEEITYHQVFEDDVEVSKNIVKTVTLKAAVPEVVMIGSRSSFSSVIIPGKIAYLSGGNAWVIEGTTSDRRLVVSTGDLDGRIFSLSKDGKLLLFTRYSNKENSINSLWVASLESDPATLIDLRVSNVVNYAEFSPDSSTLAYSTVEWRETSPGWQANNDLYERSISATGTVTPEKVLDANSGGVYGWWGMGFSWAPDGLNYLYSRSDSVGILDIKEKSLAPILDLAPFQTGGNWAWEPGISWSPDGKVVYTVSHQKLPDDGSEMNTEFDLVAIPLGGAVGMNLVKNVGMFAYPVPSPILRKSNFITSGSGTSLDQNTFSVAYLQAIFPAQSDTSGYRLAIIDRDGSNAHSLFPEQGVVGLSPQHVVWSPTPIKTQGDFAIAFLYNGNIWIIDIESGIGQQVTGDGLTSRMDWR